MGTVWALIGITFIAIAAGALAAAVGYWRDSDGPRRARVALGRVWSWMFDEPNDVYPPEAADAPEFQVERARPATEFGPLVIAGSDMDRLCGPDASLTNKYFAEIVASELADVAVDPRVMEMYVMPEVER